MRYWLMMMLLSATPAAACNQDLIKIVEWKLEEFHLDEKPYVEIVVTYKFLDKRGYRQIEGKIEIRNRSGLKFAGRMFQNTNGMKFGDTGAVFFLSPASYKANFLKSPVDEIIVVGCVFNLIYGDGTREVF